MKYYYMVDDDISGNFMGWFKTKEEFFESLKYQFDELEEEDEDFDKSEKRAIIKAFKTEDDWEESVNGFIYGVSSDKESVWEGYFVKEENKEKIIWSVADKYEVDCVDGSYVPRKNWKALATDVCEENKRNYNKSFTDLKLFKYGKDLSKDIPEVCLKVVERLCRKKTK